MQDITVHTTHGNLELVNALVEMQEHITDLESPTFVGVTEVHDLTVTGAMTVGETLDVTGVAAFTAKDTHAAGLNTQQAVNNVHDTTPTAAECVTAFGAVATLGRGFLGTIDDNDGSLISYFVWTTDSAFFWVKGTKAA